MVISGLQSDHTLIKNGQMAKKIAVFVTDFTLSGMIKCNAQILFQKKNWFNKARNFRLLC